MNIIGKTLHDTLENPENLDEFRRIFCPFHVYLMEKERMAAAQHLLYDDRQAYYEWKNCQMELQEFRKGLMKNGASRT